MPSDKPPKPEPRRWVMGGQGHGPRKFIKSRQCAAVYKRGGRAGRRCTWYAQEGRIYCARHGRGMEGVVITKEHIEALRKGGANWWARMRAIEAERPGFLREFFSSRTAVIKATRAVRKEFPAPATTDPVVKRGYKDFIKEVAAVPSVPDKPDSELTEAELFNRNRRKSLERTYEVLCLKITDDEGNVIPKLASIVKDTALRTTTLAVKVDSTAMAERRFDRMADLLRRLKGEDGPKLIEG